MVSGCYVFDRAAYYLNEIVQIAALSLMASKADNCYQPGTK
jgi:hypothetical protein